MAIGLLTVGFSEGFFAAETIRKRPDNARGRRTDGVFNRCIGRRFKFNRLQIKTVPNGGQFWIFVCTKVGLMLLSNGNRKAKIFLLTKIKHMGFSITF